MWCGSLVVLVWFQERQREPQKAEKNPKLKLCGSVKSLYWQGFQRREPQEPQEPTFLFMYRDSSENWPHGSLIRKSPITGNPYYAFSGCGFVVVLVAWVITNIVTTEWAGVGQKFSGASVRHRPSTFDGMAAKWKLFFVGRFRGMFSGVAIIETPQPLRKS